MRITRHFWLTLVLVILTMLFLGGCEAPPPTEETPSPPEKAHLPEAPPPPAKEAPSLPEATPASIPKFPWPPPYASAMVSVPDRFLRETESEQIYLRDVDLRLRSALEIAGYFEKSYYAVPDGFALVTRLEQINADGTPKPEPQRWATEVGPLREFSLAAYLRALFTSNVGYFRVIVFVITPHPFTQADVQVDSSQAIEWLYTGVNKLPSYLVEWPYSSDYSCTALIYEFVKNDLDEGARTQVPGRLTGKTHLERSQLWSHLER